MDLPLDVRLLTNTMPSNTTMDELTMMNPEK